jgi:hypothetical protein
MVISEKSYIHELSREPRIRHICLQEFSIKKIVVQTSEESIDYSRSFLEPLGKKNYLSGDSPLFLSLDGLKI